jgi:hypothetical protein
MSPAATDLRPEATALPYHQLFAVQQEAYRRLAAMLVRAADDLKAPPAGREQPAPAGFDIDFDRKSRVAVISGERGTGKTSAVLSVIHDISRRHEPNFGPAAAVGPAEQALREQVRKDIVSLFGRLVWLDMLDMSPLPAAANLCSAILVRIEEAVTRGQTAGEEKPRSYLDAPERYDSPLEKLRRLQTDVAVSWEGNLRERSGALDANAFAAEVRRTEFVRLRLNARLTEVLDGLAAEFGRRTDGRRDVLFVLPVDDFDLNPPRCLELLAMLRTLSVPRLFCVVLGDVDVAETMCGLQMAADVARVAGRATTAGFLPLHRDDVQATVANISGNVIRKLLPPNQRVYLAALRADHAVELRPPGKGPNDPSVGGWLKQVPFVFAGLDYQIRRRFPQSGSQKEGPSLYDFLFATIPPGVGGSSVADPFYEGRHFLEMPLRQLVDFWLTLEKTATGPEPDAEKLQQFRKRLHFFCREVFHAEQTLPPEARRRFRTAFDLEPDLNWAVSLDLLQLTPVGYPSRVEAPGRPGAPPQPPNRLEWTTRARGTTGWEFRGSPESDKSSPVFLAADTTGLLIFYTDLLALSRGNGEPNPAFNVTPVSYRFASTAYRFRDRELPWLSWPFPTVLTFWEADRFLGAWTKLVRQLDGLQKHGPSSPDPVPALIYHWIGLGTAVLAGREPRTLPSVFASSLQDWEVLKNEVEALYNEAFQSARVQVSVHLWLRQVLSLLNEDVLGGDDTPRQAFRASPALKTLCQQESKRFVEWHDGYLRQVKGLEGIDEAAFRSTLGAFPVWW